MCTVSVIRTPGGYRVVHARDEERTRRAGLPAVKRSAGPERWAMWPTDADAGGTWVAARSDGVVLALLNRNIPDNGRPAPTRTRGDVIPGLIGLDTIRAMRETLADEDLVGMSPFRLVAIAPDATGWLVTFDGLGLEPFEDVQPPFCLASSGLGDDRVEVRLPLFDEMVGADPVPDRQDAFHRHRWDDRPEVSVLMSRRDARTVSLTTIECALGAEPDMSVEDLPEGEAWCDPVGAELAGSSRGDRGA